MTTIAWDGKILAADRQTNHGDLRQLTQKIAVINGSLVAGAGAVPDILELQEWLRRGANPSEFPSPQRDDETRTHAIVVPPKGPAVLYMGGTIPSPVYGRFWALGSGRDFAMMAMHLGKSALQAVLLAQKFDTASGLGASYAYRGSSRIFVCSR